MSQPSSSQQFGMPTTTYHQQHHQELGGMMGSTMNPSGFDATGFDPRFETNNTTICAANGWVNSYASSGTFENLKMDPQEASAAAAAAIGIPMTAATDPQGLPRTGATAPAQAMAPHVETTPANLFSRPAYDREASSSSMDTIEEVKAIPFHECDPLLQEYVKAQNVNVSEPQATPVMEQLMTKSVGTIFDDDDDESLFPAEVLQVLERSLHSSDLLLPEPSYKKGGVDLEGWSDCESFAQAEIVAEPAGSTLEPMDLEPNDLGDIEKDLIGKTFEIYSFLNSVGMHGMIADTTPSNQASLPPMNLPANHDSMDVESIQGSELPGHQDNGNGTDDGDTAAISREDDQPPDDSMDTEDASASSGLVTPRSKDVLFGQSKNLRNHPGNIRRGELVAANLTEYDNPLNTKAQKTEITKRVIQTIYDEGGRFLKQQKKKKIKTVMEAEWVVVHDEKVIRNGVTSLFRDYRAKARQAQAEA